MSNQTEQKGGPFIFSTALNAATQPDSTVAVSETFVSRESSLDDLIHHATLQHRAVCWHKGLNADLLDSKHAPYLTVAVNETDVDHPDLNDSSPATPAGGLNVKWQVAAAQNSDDQTPVSAYVPFSSLSVVTAVSTDHVVITDTTDSANPKRALVSDIVALVPAGAPAAAQYVTLATDATLTNERVLTAGTAIDIVDAGAGSTVTIDVDLNELSTGTPSNADTFLFVDFDDNIAKRGTAPATLAALGGGSGDVVGPASATDLAAARFDTTTGKLIQDSGLLIDDVAVSLLVARTANNAVAAQTNGLTLKTGDTSNAGGTTGNATIDVGSAITLGNEGVVNVGTTNATGVNIGRLTKNTDVKGTLSSGAHTITQATALTPSLILKTTKVNTAVDQITTEYAGDVRTTNAATGTIDIPLAISGTIKASVEYVVTCVVQAVAGTGKGDPTTGDAAEYKNEGLFTTGGWYSRALSTLSIGVEIRGTVTPTLSGSNLRLTVAGVAPSGGTVTYDWHVYARARSPLSA